MVPWLMAPVHPRGRIWNQDWVRRGSGRSIDEHRRCLRETRYLGGTGPTVNDVSKLYCPDYTEEEVRKG